MERALLVTIGLVTACTPQPPTSPPGGALEPAPVLAQPTAAPTPAELRQRQARAMDAFADGILLVQARRSPTWSEDSFRQDQAFFYFTGLENTLGAVLALDGRARQALLFLPDREPGPLAARKPEASLDQGPALAVDRVLPLRELDRALRELADASASTNDGAGAKPLIYAMPDWGVPELPPTASVSTKAEAPKPVPALFARVIAERHGLLVAEAGTKVHGLMDLQSGTEHLNVRAAARASIEAWHAGFHAVGPRVTQRHVEGVVVGACLDAGARQSFWPWAPSGANAAFPRPFEALGRYDHGDRRMITGELVRLDIGCEVGHYEGDLGRTLPVSGRFDSAQRELWEAFVAAYRAGAAALRPGATGDSLFAAWSQELARHASAVKSDHARRAIQSWTQRQNVPDWQVHTTGLWASDASAGLAEGMTVAFEPNAAIDGSGYYLEDMYLVTHDGAELLTPGLPTTAQEIEEGMARPPRACAHEAAR